jgi:hypothetical protein
MVAVIYQWLGRAVCGLQCVQARAGRWKCRVGLGVCTRGILACWPLARRRGLLQQSRPPLSKYISIKLNPIVMTTCLISHGMESGQTAWFVGSTLAGACPFDLEDLM